MSELSEHVIKTFGITQAIADAIGGVDAATYRAITDVFTNRQNEEIVRCGNCLSWHRGNCYKHVYTVIDECDNEYEEGAFPMDADDFCSLGTRREEA